MGYQSEPYSWKLPEAVKRVWEACLLQKHPIILFALCLRADTVANKQVCFCNQFHNLEVWQTQIRLSEFSNVWECASHIGQQYQRVLNQISTRLNGANLQHGACQPGCLTGCVSPCRYSTKLLHLKRCHLIAFTSTPVSSSCNAQCLHCTFKVPH